MHDLCRHTEEHKQPEHTHTGKARPHARLQIFGFGESAAKPQSGKSLQHEEVEPQFTHKVKTQLNPFNKLVGPQRNLKNTLGSLAAH